MLAIQHMWSSCYIHSNFQSEQQQNLTGTKYKKNINSAISSFPLLFFDCKFNIFFNTDKKRNEIFLIIMKEINCVYI